MGGSGQSQWSRVKSVLLLVAAVWLVALVNMVLGQGLDRFGILPRTSAGLVGIPLAPLLHANVAHLVSNTAPLLVLGLMVSVRGAARFWVVTGLITLLGGFGVWLVARYAYHIGASGLVFGYFGYLLGVAWYERKARAMVIAGVALLLYGPLVWGVLPTRQFVSWEAHFFGLVAGVVVSYGLARSSGRHAGI